MASLINIGSLCTDYVYSVPSLVLAGETLASTQRQVFPGGKGLNQSIAAARAGCSVLHYGAVGADGGHLVRYLEDFGVDVSGIHQGDVASGHAFIQVDPEGQNAIVIHGGSNQTLSTTLWEDAIESSQSDDWLLLQNETNGIADMILAADKKGLQTAINLAPADPAVRELPLDKVDLLIVNEAEGCMLAAVEDDVEAFQVLAAQYPSTTLVMTLGRDGLRYLDRNSEHQGELGTFTVQAVDETAAGDAFVGFLMAALVGGLSFAAALTRASAAGALAVTRAGAAPSIPGLEEVQALVEAAAEI